MISFFLCSRRMGMCTVIRRLQNLDDHVRILLGSIWKLFLQDVLPQRPKAEDQNKMRNVKSRTVNRALMANRRTEIFWEKFIKPSSLLSCFCVIIKFLIFYLVDSLFTKLTLTKYLLNITM